MLATTSGPGLSLSLGLEALSESLGLGLRFLKPKPAQAGPKPGLPGQAGPLDSLALTDVPKRKRRSERIELAFEHNIEQQGRRVF